MAFVLKDIIFNYFPPNWWRRDTYKGVNQKGLIQRLNEMLGEDSDESLLPGIENIVENTVTPRSLISKFMPYLEELRGVPYVDTAISRRRNILQYSLRFSRIKGTKKALTSLLNLHLGFGVTITEHFESYSFDSGQTFDSSLRRFDMTKCTQNCTDYTVALTGANPSLTAAEFKAIFDVIRWNEPINARLRACTYNGDLLIPIVVYISIDSEGNLTYNNDYDPYLVVTLGQGGDLVISGINASKYSINDEGDLIFTP